MLGWGITIYRLTDLSPLAASPDVPALSVAFPGVSERESLLKSLEPGKWFATWQTGLGGLKWIDDLVRNQRALDLPGGGYPYPYVALARDLLPPVLAGPPDANRVWAYGAHDIVGSEWLGKTVIDHEEASSITPGEWLFVEAWDQN